MARILIVDDEESIRKSLRLFLRDAGYEVEAAEDVPAAQKLLKENSYDVVVTDIVMPRLTGVDLLQTIRPALPHVPVIMMTGLPNVETAAAAVRAGAFAYLRKPVSPAEMLRCIESAVQFKTSSGTRNQV